MVTLLKHVNKMLPTGYFATARKVHSSDSKLYWHTVYILSSTRSAWQSLECSPPALAVSPPGEKQRNKTDYRSVAV